MSLIGLTTDLKAGWAVVMGTFATVVADAVKMAPSNVTEWAALFGCILTAVLIVTHIVKGVRDGRRHKVDLAIAELQLEKLQSEVKSL